MFRGSTAVIIVLAAAGRDRVEPHPAGRPDSRNDLTPAGPDSRVDGAVTLDLADAEPGDDTVRLLLDDGYVVLAGTTLTVGPAGSGPAATPPAAPPAA